MSKRYPDGIDISEHPEQCSGLFVGVINFPYEGYSFTEAFATLERTMEVARDFTSSMYDLEMIIKISEIIIPKDVTNGGNLGKNL
jgi:hypothetical protein